MDINEVNAIGVKFREGGEEQVYVNIHNTISAYGKTYHRFVKMKNYKKGESFLGSDYGICQEYFDKQVSKGLIRVIQTFGEIAQ